MKKSCYNCHRYPVCSVVIGDDFTTHGFCCQGWEGKQIVLYNHFYRFSDGHIYSTGFTSLDATEHPAAQANEVVKTESRVLEA